jgi:hypothetical protein
MITSLTFLIYITTQSSNILIGVLFTYLRPLVALHDPPVLLCPHDMTIVDGNSENDLIQLFNRVQDLSEQLTQNRSISFSLHASAGAIKVLHPFTKVRESRLIEP